MQTPNLNTNLHVWFSTVFLKLGCNCQFGKGSGKCLRHVVFEFFHISVCAGVQGAVCSRHSCRGLDWRADIQDLWTRTIVHL